MLAEGLSLSSVFSARSHHQDTEKQRRRRRRRRRRDLAIIAGSSCFVGVYLCFTGSLSDGGVVRRELAATKRPHQNKRNKQKKKGRVLADGSTVSTDDTTDGTAQTSTEFIVGNIVTSTPHRQTHTLDLLIGSSRSPHTFAISTGLDIPLLLPCARCNGCNACPEIVDTDFAGKIDNVDDLHKCYDPSFSRTAVFTECSDCPSLSQYECGASTGGMCLSSSTIGSTVTNEKGFVQDGTYTTTEVADVATLVFNRASNSFTSRSSAPKVGKKDSVTLPIVIDCLSQAEGFAAENLGAYGDVDGDGDEKDDARWRGGGLVGMSAAPTSFLSLLVEEDVIPSRKFGVCFDRMSFGVVLTDEQREASGIEDGQVGRNDNVVSLGDVDRSHHVTPLVFARNSALKRKASDNSNEDIKTSYAVRLRKVYLRQGDIESAAFIGDEPVPSIASIGNDYGEDATVYALTKVDYDRINGGKSGNLPGVSIDTELSYTYLDKAIEQDFMSAFEEISGRKFTYLGMELTNEEVRTLPTVLLQLEADNAEQTGVDPSTIPGLAAYENLDTHHPYDVVLAIPPSHYMKYDHNTDRFSIKLFVSIEDPSGISRLGSNVFQGHGLLFDIDEGRVGFAEHDGCVGGDSMDSKNTGVRLFGTASRGTPSIADSFVSSVSNLFVGDGSKNGLSEGDGVPMKASPRSPVAPKSSSNALWPVIGTICFLLGVMVVLAVDRVVERRARANDDGASEGENAEMNTIGSGDRSIGVPERSTRDMFDYRNEAIGRSRSVGMNDIELEQERMRASFTSLASGDGKRYGEHSFGASRTLRWKQDRN
mmetsp:Transcript_3602/g.10252  ORF Transcript_3602/g.10252 Transcript_3602/m.10252 type:complete len:819 (-) Transcript_3602:39-2495(-)